MNDWKSCSERDDCMKALQCIYLEAVKPVADDLNFKVKSYIELLEKTIKDLQGEQK